MDLRRVLPMFLVFLAAGAANGARRIYYENYHLYEILVMDEGDVDSTSDLLHRLSDPKELDSGLKEIDSGVLVLDGPRKTTATPRGWTWMLLAAPSKTGHVERFLAGARLQYRLLDADYSREVRRALGQVAQFAPDLDGDFGVQRQAVAFDPTKYNMLEAITAWLQGLATDHPTKVQESSAGQTAEGRDIPVVRLSSDLTSTTRPVIVVLGGVHAREWLAMHSVLRAVHLLLNDNTALSTFEWAVFPVTNPDGYAYSMAADNLWRKNRRVEGGCIGVDLNRNFPFEWRAAAGCDFQTHPGSGPGSEAETSAVTAYVTALGPRVRALVDIHGFSQAMILPYDYSCGSQPSNIVQQKNIAQLMAAAAKTVRGHTYSVGSICETLGYTARGTSTDWAQDSLTTSVVNLGIEVFPEDCDQLSCLSSSSSSLNADDRVFGLDNVQNAQGQSPSSPDQRTSSLEGCVDEVVTSCFQPDASNIQPTGEEMFKSLTELAKQLNAL